MPCPVRRWLAVSGSRLARGQVIRAWTLLHAPPQNRKILLASVSYSTDHFQREARMPPLLCPDTRGSFNIKKWVYVRPPGYSHHTRLLLVAIRHYISQAQHFLVMATLEMAVCSELQTPCSNGLVVLFHCIYSQSLSMSLATEVLSKLCLLTLTRETTQALQQSLIVECVFQSP